MKTFWKPSLGGPKAYYAEYRQILDCGGEGIWINRRFENGKEREEFIKDQSRLIRRCKDDHEYVDLYNFILTLTE